MRKALSLCCTLAFAALAPVAAPAGLSAATLDVTTIAFQEDDLELVSVEGLQWRGGLAVTMNDRRFGGLSALLVSPDGESLIAVTDRGQWFRARLSYRDGHLTGMHSPRFDPILDLSGKPLTRPRTDAESLARGTDGDLIVGFERAHRLWRYAGPTDPTRSAARTLAAPEDLRKLPNNGGIEALTRLCDGRLLAIAEQSRTAHGSVPAWVGGKTGWDPLRIKVTDGLRPTGAATLSDCDVILVERSFSLVAGLDIRISKAPAQAIRPDSVIQPRRIARLSSPLSIDNFEGISVRQNATGETLVYLVSDDNFSDLQRTLLVMFRLDDAD